MRKVEVYKYDFENRQAGEKVKLIKEYEAIFHQFGVDYEEFDSGAVNYSTAIIELQDGTVKNIPVNLIKFISH